jgi:hypothetical protein
VESKRLFSLSPSVFISRFLALLIGCLGLVWGLSDVVRGATSDEFRDIEDRVLQFETFGRDISISTLESPGVSKLSVCDSHAQRALLLLEIPLADVALRSGAVRDFDRRVQSLETRSRQVVSCAPRDSLTWLLLFGLEVERGQLNDHSFDLLQASYETSPNEAWVGVRRVAIAMPVVLAAPKPIQQKILTEFQNLVMNGFREIPASCYLRASAPVRALLQSRIEQLDSASQKAFSEALAAARRS